MGCGVAQVMALACNSCEGQRGLARLLGAGRGGMRERLKRVVLKTTVRETVPGVRIPLPPPETQAGS